MNTLYSLNIGSKLCVKTTSLLILFIVGNGNSIYIYIKHNLPLF